MRHRTVADLMAPTAVSVQRGTAFKEIARLLDEFEITAVPVVDESERPVGVVSEADLLHRRVAGSGATTAADPRPLFDFNVSVLLYGVVYGVAEQLLHRDHAIHGAAEPSDRYPPSGLGPECSYPAQLDVACPERLYRGLVLMKWWLLACPALPQPGRLRALHVQPARVRLEGILTRRCPDGFHVSIGRPLQLLSQVLHGPGSGKFISDLGYVVVLRRAARSAVTGELVRAGVHFQTGLRRPVLLEEVEPDLPLGSV